jgi:hypothetical protein
MISHAAEAGTSKRLQCMKLCQFFRRVLVLKYTGDKNLKLTFFMEVLV